MPSSCVPPVPTDTATAVSTVTFCRKKPFSCLPQQPWAIQTERSLSSCRCLRAPRSSLHWHRHCSRARVFSRYEDAGREEREHFVATPAFLFSKIKISLLFLTCSSASICPVLIFITLDILNLPDTWMILLSFQKFFFLTWQQILSQAFTFQHNMLLL